MSTPPSTPTGFVDSLRALGAGLTASLHDRVGLVAIELQEEKCRLIQTLVWLGAALFAGVMLAIFASLSLVYCFWETARLAALGGLTLLYAAALVAVVIGFRRFLARQPTPFAATLAELDGDRACFQPTN